MRLDKNGEVDIFWNKQTCPRCGSEMRGDDVRFECPECGVLFLVNGEYLTPDERAYRHQLEHGPKCYNCGRPLAGGSFRPAWSEGGNSSTTKKCPHCGAINNLDYFDD